MKGGCPRMAGHGLGGSLKIMAGTADPAQTKELGVEFEDKEFR